MTYERKYLIKKSINTIRIQKELYEEQNKNRLCYSHSKDVAHFLYMLGIINFEKVKLLESIIERYYGRLGD